MGTSKGYAAPTGGRWTKLKRDVSVLARDPALVASSGGQPDPRIGGILAQLVGALGGAAAIAHAATAGGGGGGGASAGSVGGVGAGAARTGAELGGFASTVADAGISQALRRFDLDDLVGRPADEVAEAIVERLSGVPSGLDEAAAREALISLLTELGGNASTLEELEAAYRKAMDAYGIRGLMIRYFGYYLYVLFCERFTERLGRNPDHAGPATALASQLREYILVAVEGRLQATGDVSDVDWTGAEGLGIAEDVLQETLEVFEIKE